MIIGQSGSRKEIAKIEIVGQEYSVPTSFGDLHVFSAIKKKAVEAGKLENPYGNTPYSVPRTFCFLW